MQSNSKLILLISKCEHCLHRLVYLSRCGLYYINYLSLVKTVLQHLLDQGKEMVVALVVSYIVIVIGDNRK